MTGNMSIPQSKTNVVHGITIADGGLGRERPQREPRRRSKTAPYMASSHLAQAFSTNTFSLPLFALRSKSSTSLVSPSSPPQPPQPGAAVSEDTNTSAIGGVGVNNIMTTDNSDSEGSSAASDLVQHCLLFPTYATQHSQSESNDPPDWNIRVQGWAYSTRSNRRNRLVMSTYMLRGG
ncbi:hypothetical protein EDD21DRAFT_141716 [Dissophora ornata]|nr:hypothetical protein EDD21DRAFT_141716 [Dissophora ornata]